MKNMIKNKILSNKYNNEKEEEDEIDNENIEIPKNYSLNQTKVKNNFQTNLPLKIDTKKNPEYTDKRRN